MGYFKTVVEAGATIEVTKSYTKRVGAKARGKKGKPTAEEIEKVNQMNAERTLRLKINNNFGVDDPFITLTYRPGERPEPEKAKKDIKKLIDGLRKWFKKVGADLKWVCVTEYKKKAIHHHLLVNHIEGQDVSKWVRRLWGHGRPHFKYLDGTGQYKDLAAYLIKETSKTYKAKDGARKQRYSCSRNLATPEPKTEIIRKAKKWLPDPKPVKGYYIDKDTVYNGVDPFTGRAYQKYTMIRIQGSRGSGCRYVDNP
ncbi:hypothetical protein AALC25_19090 [Lachnospiraceae bacterium 29-84]